MNLIATECATRIGKYSKSIEEERSQYYKSEIFRENLIFANSVEIHICDVKIRDYGGFTDRVIASFREGFIFHETSKIKTSRKFQNFRYMRRYYFQH